MKTLFEKPLAHTNDPITSFDAADKIVKSGALSRQEKQVHKAIVKFFSVPNRPFTARGLAFVSNIDYFVIQRRLSGLHNKGKIQRTGEKRDGCCVWRIK